MAKKNENQKNLVECWNKIGVWGTEHPRCEKLNSVDHCRNCDTYSEGGRDLLNRKPPAGYLKEWANILVTEKELEALGTESILIFRLGAEWLAIPTLSFREIVEEGGIHTVPHRTDHVFKGIVNVHGELLLFLSLSNLLELDSGRKKGQTMSPLVYKRMVVLEHEGDTWVFQADEVYGIHRYDEGDVLNVPVTISKATSKFMKGIIKWEKKEVGLIDEELLFYTLKRRVS